MDGTRSIVACTSVDGLHVSLWECTVPTKAKVDKIAKTKEAATKVIEVPKATAGLAITTIRFVLAGVLSFMKSVLLAFTGISMVVALFLIVSVSRMQDNCC